MENNEKVIALYKYIKELCAMKYHIVTDVNKQIWTYFLKDIPVDPDNITIYYRDRVEEDEIGGDSVLLEVKKPDFQRCPQPSEAFSDWLIPGWDQYVNEVRYKETLVEISDPILNGNQQNSKVEHFGDSPERIKAYEKWLSIRAIWAEKQRIINQTRKFFARLFQLYTDLERDSEVLELMVGEGLMRDIRNPNINHPILLKRVKFSFNAKANTISILDTDMETELYTMLLQEMSDINHGVVKQLKEDLNNNFYHPLDRNDTPDFLKILTHRLCSESKFIVEPGDKICSEDRLLTSLSPVFFVRKRIDGTLKAIEEIIHNIEKNEVVPGHLIDIVSGGIVEVPSDSYEPTIDEQLAALGGESEQVLLSKEANREQLEIAERISHYNAVLVQGPPGTGKTHTIANLLGHFLAQGKSVLVTSHTKKALSVLKEKVPYEIQNLCVSVLDDTNLDMERSVDGISEYLSRYTSNELKKKVESASRQRKDIIGELASVRKKIFQIRYREYEPIVYNGDGYSPAKAAAFVNANAEELSYIPGKVRLSHPLPVTIEELVRLYQSNGGITEKEESELDFNIPDPELLPYPVSFYADLRKSGECKTTLEILGKELGGELYADFETDIVCLNNGEIVVPLTKYPKADALAQLTKYKNTFRAIDDWMIQAAVDGNKGGGYKSRWDMLIESIEDTASYTDSIVTHMIGYKITIQEASDFSQLKLQLQKLQDVFKKKGRISKVDLLFNKQLETALAQIKVNGSSISTLEECQLTQKQLILNEKRLYTARLWNELMAKHGAPKFFDLGDEPERICIQRVPHIRRYLEWYQNEYNELLRMIENAGLAAELIFTSHDLDSELARMEKVLRSIHTVIPVHIEVVNTYLCLKGIEANLSNALSELVRGERKNSNLCLSLSGALQNRNPELYEQKFDELTILYDKYEVKKQRAETLAKIEQIAPEWAYAIRNRVGIHGETSCPQTIEDAWMWKQFAGIVDDITKEPFEDLQYKAVCLSKDLRAVTAVVAANSAWYHLLLRTERNLDMRQALQGWKQTMRKIGKGTGRNAPTLKKRAVELMSKCQSAVPAWIMTVNKALESLNPAENFFDVIIIDEASQSDISALSVVYMAKKVIIVGDDKQVSPMAIGVDLDKINALREMYIKDVINNSHLYDAKSSLYDIAATTFQPLMLREHFRCVPDIIGYSNKLSYDYKIKPLRDANDCHISPSVVAYRVDDGYRQGQQKINIKEAETVVSLMKACIDQKEYDGMTFGAISLLGDEQAQIIQQMILEKIEPSIIDERRILCGNASHFQGDERDVVFLSLVDSNEGDGPLSMAGEGADQSRKQRYNVAASRAKNQMWVIHSLDYTKDLKPRDLRRDLLEYVENPKSYSRLVEAVIAKAESPFEEAVGKSLVAAGYNLAQQWEVGAYRIDMVALYSGSSVAIECDGELYHSGEEKVREDMERQAILERLGWRFIRIRGSEYYRNPEVTMARVFRELNDFGIYPERLIEANTEVGQSELLSRVKIRAAQIIDEWNFENKDLGSINSYNERVIEFPKNNPAQHDEECLRIHPSPRIERVRKTATTEVKKENQHISKPHTNIESNTTSVSKADLQHRNLDNKQKESKQKGSKQEPPLVTRLKFEGINYIDKREQSGIVWVLYSDEVKNKVESICKEMGTLLAFEKRGAPSTDNKPAWRIMMK